MKHYYSTENQLHLLSTCYTVLEQEKLLLESYHGDITLENAKAHIIKHLQEPSFNTQFDILTDLSGSVISLLVNEIPDYIDIFNKLPNESGKRKLALLLSTPNHLIYTYLLFLNREKINIDVQTFTSARKALQWLGKQEHEEKVVKTLKVIYMQPAVSA